MLTLNLVVLREGAPEDRPYPHDGEERRRHARRTGIRRLAAFVAQPVAAAVRDSKRFERLLLVAPVLKRLRRRAAAAKRHRAFGIELEDRDQAIVLIEWQSAQHH